MGLDSLLKLAVDASLGAAKAIMGEQKSLQVWHKDDGSLLSSADLISDEIISLKLGASSLPILSEENVKEYKGGNDTFWLIDPIDGTRSFCKGSKDFCILIALISQKRPILALLNAPARGLLFYAHKDTKLYKNGKIAHKRDLRRHKNIALLSEFHKSPAEEEFVKKNSLRPSYVSSALKTAKLLEGQASVYFKATPLHIWDIAASDLLLQKGGGCLLTHTGKELLYDDKSLLSKPFIALANKESFKDFTI